MNKRPRCNISGCNRLVILRTGRDRFYRDGTQKYRKRCSRHSRNKNHRWNKGNPRTRLRKRLLKDKCSLCGWNGPCDHHRIVMGIDGGTYIRGNVVVVCPNCHRLIHRGLLNGKIK